MAEGAGAKSSGRRSGPSSVRPELLTAGALRGAISRDSKRSCASSAKETCVEVKKGTDTLFATGWFSSVLLAAKVILEESHCTLVCRRDGGEGNGGFYCSLLDLKLPFRTNIWCLFPCCSHAVTVPYRTLYGGLWRHSSHTCSGCWATRECLYYIYIHTGLHDEK